MRKKEKASIPSIMDQPPQIYKKRKWQKNHPNNGRKKYTLPDCTVCNSLGFPTINSLTRKKAPKDNRYPVTIHAPHPISRSVQVRLGNILHNMSSSSCCCCCCASACLSSVVDLVGRRLAKSILSNMIMLLLSWLLCLY